MFEDGLSLYVNSHSLFTTAVAKVISTCISFYLIITCLSIEKENIVSGCISICSSPQTEGH